MQMPSPVMKTRAAALYRLQPHSSYKNRMMDPQFQNRSRSLDIIHVAAVNSATYYSFKRNSDLVCRQA